MLELFGSGLISLWLNVVAGEPRALTPGDLSTMWDTPTVVLAGDQDPNAQAIVQQYVKNLLIKKNVVESAQGVWIQSGTLLADHQGNVPLPAASLTKVATTLAALETWGPNHQFETLVSATGPIQAGVLQGDLVIQGGGDPLFVWEEAIVLGNALQKLGIKRVTGNLVILGDFYMNYETEPALVGKLLKQALDARTWTEEAGYQYLYLPKGTPKPEITIAGTVKAAKLPLPKQILLLRHRSLPLVQILKQMNVYSNNPMAEMLAKSVGGPQVVAQLAAQAAGVPRQEIQLINGSGLGPENRISPRAVCAMLATIQRYLSPPLPIIKEVPKTIADLFPVMGRDQGTLVAREMPDAAVVKTGTLRDVSALAGVFPTRDHGLVWFAIINRGEDVDEFRNKQDALLQTLVQRWGRVPEVPATIAPKTTLEEEFSSFGASNRNEIVFKE